MKQTGSHVAQLLSDDEREPEECARLVQLMLLFAELPPPPDPQGLLPRYAEHHARFLTSVEGDDSDELEEAFLSLYAHVHGHEAPYTKDERKRMDATGGYWAHAGGLSPILRAPPFLRPDSISCDLGAGNGLQGLLMQHLAPHRRTIQVELSHRMVEAGRHLQAWLGIADERVEWRVGDVCDFSPAGVDFLYLYRPLRPEGEAGRRFYTRLAGELSQGDRQVVIFSIADCLRDFLSPDRFEVFYGDGHLTCFRRR